MQVRARGALALATSVPVKAALPRGSPVTVTFTVTDACGASTLGLVAGSSLGSSSGDAVNITVAAIDAAKLSLVDRDAASALLRHRVPPTPRS